MIRFKTDISAGRSQGSLKRQGAAGSALILTIWLLGLLSIFAISVGVTARQRIRSVKYFEDREKLRIVADSGIQTAIAVIGKKNPNGVYNALNGRWSQSPDDFKNRPVGDEGTFSITSPVDFNNPSGLVSRGSKTEVRYGIVDEERKLNLNKIKSPEILTNFFQYAANLVKEDAYILAVSILDWKDEDDFPYDQGAESFYYKGRNPPYVPKNADFTVLEELIYVKGMTPEIYRQILPYVTVHSTGQINLNTASRVVLMSLNFSSTLTSKILRYRAGPDAVEGTGDDGIFKKLDTVVDNLNHRHPLTNAERQSLEDFIGSGLFTVHSTYFKVNSTAQLPGGRWPMYTTESIITDDGTVHESKGYFTFANKGNLL